MRAPAGDPMARVGPTGARSGPTPGSTQLCLNGPRPGAGPSAVVGAGVWLITRSFTLLHKLELAGPEGRGRLAGDAPLSLGAQINREDPPSSHAGVYVSTVGARLLLLCLALEGGHLILKFMQKKNKEKEPEEL